MVGKIPSLDKHSKHKRKVCVRTWQFGRIFNRFEFCKCLFISFCVYGNSIILFLALVWFTCKQII